MSIPTDPSFTTDRARRLAVHLGITEAEAGWAITNIWRWATNARRDGYLGDTDAVDLLIEGRLEYVIDAVSAGHLKDALVRAAVIDADGFLTDWNLLGGRPARNAAERQATVMAPVAPGTRAKRSDFPSEEAWKHHQRQLSAARSKRNRATRRDASVTLDGPSVTLRDATVTLPAPPSVTEPGGFPDQRHACPRLQDSGENGEGERGGATDVRNLSPDRSATETPIPAARQAYVDAMRAGGSTVLPHDRVVAEIVDPVDVETAIRLATAMLSVDKWGSARLKANPNLRWVSQDLGKYTVYEKRLACLAADEERRRLSNTETVTEVTERVDVTGIVDVVDVIDPAWPAWFVAWRGAVRSTATGGLWAFACSFRPDPSGTVQIIVPNRFAYVQIMKGTHLDALRAAGELADIAIDAATFQCTDGAGRTDVAARVATRPGSSGRLITEAMLAGDPKDAVRALCNAAPKE